jgi:hypothetical protein
MPTIDEALEIALQHHNAGALSEAEDIYRKILEVQPDHPVAKRRLDCVETQRPEQASIRLMTALHRAMVHQNTIQSHLLLETLRADPRYADPRRLERFGGRSYSQNDEDGILQEIFRRIGVADKTFLEFGVESGVENNSLLLLHQGWRGAWLEAGERHIESINKTFKHFIDAGQLTAVNTLVTRGNINRIITDLGLPKDLDLISIDIDSNDYYIFEDLSAVSPRVVCIEYNARFLPPTKAVIPYNEDFRWRGTDYFGASLQSLTDLADRKGYRLVACNLSGANAFFVRDDLVGDHFQPPFTAENFYQPARYFFGSYTYAGDHRMEIGVYERR